MKRNDPGKHLEVRVPELQGSLRWANGSLEQSENEIEILACCVRRQNHE
jgi:hypothetical protein